jgi:preprotein translocase subunit YajC
MTFSYALLSATTVAAQDAAPSAGVGTLGILFPYIVIFFLFYWLFIRPQQRQRRAHEDRIRQVRKGDEVVTAGGVVGEVVHIREGLKDGTPTVTLEDRITIKSGESRIVIERGRIARIVGGTTAPGDDKAR